VLNRPLESIAAGDIQDLVANRVTEGRSLDYKDALPGGGDDDKRGFLADVAALANTRGGHLLFGVSEERDEHRRPTGIPKEAVGLRDNLDAEILRLEAICRDGITPRITGIRFRPVPGFRAGPVLLCWIPKSWRAPHMVTFKNLSRFYARAANGNYQLDIDQIRDAFLRSETLRERIRRFRLDRLNTIRDETLLPLFSPTRIILHLIPLATFDTWGPEDTEESLDLANANPRPLFGSADSYRFNFDGRLGYTVTKGQVRRCARYVQLFRNGVIEGVDAYFLSEEKRPRIPSTALERNLVESVSGYFRNFKEWKVPGPLLLTLSFLGIKGWEMGTKVDIMDLRDDQPQPIDRDYIDLPEVWIEDVPPSGPGDAATYLWLPLDVLWQSAGFSGSLNYDSAGKWTAG
jgi:hypothetical protein